MKLTLLLLAAAAAFAQQQPVPTAINYMRAI
jgi:hypothetical protein